MQDPLEERFRRLCLAAIEREVPVRERWQLGVTLGRLGDPRIVADLRDRAASVEIAAGTYRLGQERRPHRIEQPFLISRYPVPNGQYHLFIAEGGYEESRWWSAAGRAWLKCVRERGLWWRIAHALWNEPNQTVVGVSFREAEAFCR